MAYGNWGAFVYKDGVRQSNREDNTPFHEDELEAGYWQAFAGNNEDGTRVTTGKKIHCHHASLGDGEFRLCGYKSYPRIFLKGEEIEIEKYAIGGASEGWNWWDSQGISGEIEGFKFSAHPFSNPERVELELIQPDGTKWTGKSGYCIGSGHE